MSFKIPIGLFIFKRHDLLLQIIERLSYIKPEKIYLISDGPRNSTEEKEVMKTRKIAEKNITWECDIIKIYNHKNVGVIDNIGKGAIQVFQNEKSAIFLEDDNLPNITFFRFCQEMLERYFDIPQIGWVCGTNYLEDSTNILDESYTFTKQLLPCGWASWSHKFLQFYDINLDRFNESYELKRRLRKTYLNRNLFPQQYYNFRKTKYMIMTQRSRSSWDYQMAFSIRINNLYGICPAVNLIKNIGVDSRSTHGGTSMTKTMTNRFCRMQDIPIIFPLTHPKEIKINILFERKISNIISIPTGKVLLIYVFRFLKKIFGINEYKSINEIIK